MKNHQLWLKIAVLLAVVLVLVTPSLTARADTATQGTGVTAVSRIYNLRLRSGPGTNYTQIGLIIAGHTVAVNGRNADNSWLYVDYSSAKGWASAAYLTVNGSLAAVPVVDAGGNPVGGTTTQPPAASPSATATPLYYLNFRSGPGTNYPSFDVVPPRTTVSVFGRSSDSRWVYVEFNGRKGWFAAWLATINGDLNSMPEVDANGNPVGGGAAPTAQPTSQPTQQPTATSLTATINYYIWFRAGPGTTYTKLGSIRYGTSVTVLGRNADSSWAYVDWNGSRGWVAAWLITIGGDINTLPEVDANGNPVGGGTLPGAQPTPAPTSGPTPEPTAQPTPTTPGTNPAAGGFELGGQTHTLDHSDLMRSAGMTWVKFQYKWSPGANPNDVQWMIQRAHDNGFKVLLSIPGQLYPSSIDFASYAQFLGGVAALGPDAIEVWNEQNFDTEWPAGQVHPANYVSQMLIPAYQAIKAANPNVMVIAGGPTPTGTYVPGNIWPDDYYIRGMRDAGAANYMDCMGVHFNAGATSPDATTGHPADSNG
nr:SH3 domain-containing protein [Anaerolineae bacterium]